MVMTKRRVVLTCLAYLFGVAWFYQGVVADNLLLADHYRSAGFRMVLSIGAFTAAVDVWQHRYSERNWGTRLMGDWGMDEHERRRLETAQALARILTDLDRCMHGRHQGDACFDCPNGESVGNHILPTGAVVGYGLYGLRYVMPERGRLNDPEAWLGVGND